MIIRKGYMTPNPHRPKTGFYRFGTAGYELWFRGFWLGVYFG